MTPQEIRELAVWAVFGHGWECDVVRKVYVREGEWRGPRLGSERCDAVVQRITEYGESCAHNAAMEER